MRPPPCSCPVSLILQTDLSGLRRGVGSRDVSSGPGTESLGSVPPHTHVGPPGFGQQEPGVLESFAGGWVVEGGGLWAEPLTRLHFPAEVRAAWRPAPLHTPGPWSSVPRPCALWVGYSAQHALCLAPALGSVVLMNEQLYLTSGHHSFHLKKEKRSPLWV